MFTQVPVQPGQTSALLQYFGILLEQGIYIYQLAHLVMFEIKKLKSK